MKNETPVVTVSSAPYLRLIPVLIIATLMAFCPTLTRADTIAFSFIDGGTHIGAANTTAGYAFTLSSPVNVTELGVWDLGNDGLLESHLVTIWTSTGTQEAQGTVPSATGGTLTNGFRYVSIAPVLLPAGSYTIGTFFPDTADLVATLNSSITPASGVTYDDSRIGLGNAFPSGQVIVRENSFFGPNFQFTTATSVPDTGMTCSLFGLSFMGLAFLRRKLC